MPISGFESFFLDKLIEYLKLLGKDFNVAPNAILVNEKIGDQKYQITVIPTEKWIRIVARFDKIDDIPEEKRLEFMRNLLKATWDYPEINFALDDEGYIVSIQDEYVHALYLDTFEEEYAAVIVSIDVYNKIKTNVLGLKKQEKIAEKEK